MKTLILLLSLFVNSITVIAANDSTAFQKGIARYLRLDYKESFNHFKEATRQNVAEAYTMLAMRI